MGIMDKLYEVSNLDGRPTWRAVLAIGVGIARHPGAALVAYRDQKTEDARICRRSWHKSLANALCGV